MGINLLSARLSSSLRRTASSISNDFYGISKITSKDIAGAFKTSTKLGRDELQARYRLLKGPRNVLQNQEHETDRGFGTVRLDSDNVPKSHGQFEEFNFKIRSSTVEVKQRYVPVDEETEISSSFVESEEVPIKNIPGYNPPYLISEVEPIMTLNEALRLLENAQISENISRYSNPAPLIFFFDNELKPENKKGSDVDGQIDSASGRSDDNFRLSGRKLLDDDIHQAIIETTNRTDKKPTLDYDSEIDEIKEEDLNAPVLDEFENAPKNIDVDFKFDETLDEKYRPQKERVRINALDYLKDVKASRVESTAKGLKHRRVEVDSYATKGEEIILDSKGHRVYSNQVTDWSKVRHIDILELVRKSIIYNNHDVIAINKPYGIASHGDDDKNLDMNTIVGEIALSMKIPKVYLAHRLDKTTTGVLLFATSEERARKLHKAFRADQVKKTYWCIVRGVPAESAAIIDMPIATFNLAGKMRMCPAPISASVDQQLSKRFREARRAVTEYKVLTTSCGASLLEVKPRSGVKHQIRCHLGFGLNTPILGDHKYSHIAKMAPQKLSTSTLKALQLRQQKVRTLPIHLHARSIVLAGVKPDGTPLFISAPLPAHFSANLKSLGMKLDEL